MVGKDYRSWNCTPAPRGRLPNPLAGKSRDCPGPPGMELLPADCPDKGPQG